MKEFLLDYLKKAWLKPKSILPSFALLSIIYVALVSAVGAWDGITFNTRAYYAIAIPFGLAWLAYSVACLYAYRLPSAPDGYLAVLFCIDAESDKLYAAAKNKLVSNFTASLSHNSSIRFRALCVPKERIAKYDITQDADALSLLQKTRGVILVDVRYTADDVDASENFSLKINYGVRHPNFDETAEKALAYDMSQLGAPLRNRRFQKKETIDVFDFSTQALVFVCQYIIGFVLLLAGDGNNAIVLLKQARQTVARNDGAGFDVKNLTQLVDDRLFSAYRRVAAEYLRLFQDDHSLGHLRDADAMLELANQIRPDTYSYNLLKAYVLVMLYQDSKAARKCIEKCKQSNQNQDWTYSEAFLSAYAGHTPGRVISKYNRAFNVSDENLVELADYIEVVHEREPEKITLHLALGLIYHRMGNHKQANFHLSKYMVLSKDMERRAKEKIERLIQPTKCDAECARNCSSCGTLDAG